METEYQRGEAHARAENLSREMIELKEALTSLKHEVGRINITMARIEGGWKVAVAVAAGIGALVGFLMRYFFTQ